MATHLFVYASGTPMGVPASTAWSVLPQRASDVAAHVASIVADRSIDVLVFWDLRLAPVPWSAVERFKASTDDAWHAGSRLTGTDELDLLRHTQPMWIYRPVPAPERAGVVSWRLDFRATLLRASVVRAIGGLDPQLSSITGVARELGLRLIRRGAVMRQMPDLAPGISFAEPLPLDDAFRLLRRSASSKWIAYTLARRMLDDPRTLGRDLRAWYATRGDKAMPAAPRGALARDVSTISLPDRPSVSVVLPTIGRYRYVAEVLDDLRAQSIRPTQIIVADGNIAEDREPDVYAKYPDLPLEVFWHEEPGICSGRNASLARATGDYIWFVDDDSRFERDNLEAHLRVLHGYGADVSVGPAYMRGRPELTADQQEIACSFMDCGTTVCRREILERTGGFDMQFNRHLAGEDNDLGIRFIRSGGVMLNNPLAKRFHYFAPVGGSRSKGSVHVFRRWSLRPRPVQSLYYLARRYFEPGVAFDAVLQAGLKIGWRRRDAMPPSRAWRLRTLVEEVLAAPLTAWRFRESVRLGREMVARGPDIPDLTRSATPRASTR